ncbi:MAG TPA: hypothetical protein VHQ03_08340 [Candidatus Dormibacteraeota bacterium]|nr:hypothetical protein [Candidatus Dormibacteraeota bacterium]
MVVDDRRDAVRVGCRLVEHPDVDPMRHEDLYGALALVAIEQGENSEH